jgi:hypothetical protein
MLGPIQSHPFDPFQIVTSGLNEILVLDSRYARTPLLRWNHGLSDAPPEMLCVVRVVFERQSFHFFHVSMT